LGTRARRQHEAIGSELVVANPQDLRAQETGLAGEHVDAVRPAVGDGPAGARVDAAEGPVTDRRPVRPGGRRTRPLTADGGQILAAWWRTAPMDTETDVPPAGHALGEGGADRAEIVTMFFVSHPELPQL
jgi:hypothetical protein